MNSMTQKFAAVIWPLMMIEMAKFWNRLKRKPKNVSQSHEQTFGTILKQIFPFDQPGIGSSFILCHRDDLAETKVHHKKTRNWKFHILSWTKRNETKRYAACESTSRG
jgi:hypothetical protein